MDYDRNERSDGGFDPQQRPDPTPDAPRDEEPLAPPPAQPAGYAQHGQYGQYVPLGLPQSTVAVPTFVLGLVGLLLAFPLSCLCYGIPAIIGGAFGVAAWVMGHKERARIAAGEVAPNGLLTAGYVMGIITTILAVLVLLMLVAVIVLVSIGAIAEPTLNGMGN
jgi:hypothetical protein